MKLLKKTNLYFLSVALMVFCLGGVLFYFLFQTLIDNDFNKRLLERRDYFIQVLSQSDSLLYYQQFSANAISVRPITSFQDTEQTISDTVIYDAIQRKENRYRQMSLNKSINGRNYRISVRRPLVEGKDVIEGVILVEMVLFLAFVAILTLLNNQLSRTLWRPFYQFLDRIGLYKADGAEIVTFPRTGITEFNELARAVEMMTTKIHREFHTQKEIIENTSHEIQTPLAIVKNKLEVLLQTPGLGPDQMALISAAFVAADRLSKLNEALVILSRIENRQFHNEEPISIKELAESQIEVLKELADLKNIRISLEYSADPVTRMNRYLAEIMIGNLITNALKHNVANGSILIKVESGRLIISNTGDPPQVEVSGLFSRFSKSNPKSQSPGLGLAIVKAICETYGWSVGYTYNDGFHRIIVQFAATAT